MELEIGSGQSLFYDNTAMSQMIKIDTSSSMYIFDEAAIITPRIDQNALGCYTFVNVGSNGEAIFGSFDTPEFNLRGGLQSCVWDPLKCGNKFGSKRVPTCPINHQSELCIDVAWKGCWSSLLGVGNGKYDWDSTQGAAALLAKAIGNKLRGIGNDFYYLMHLAGHPMIQKSYENGWYKINGVDPKKFECFRQMMAACNGGFLTMADSLRSVDKLPNMMLNIPDAWISADGSKFIGDAIELFDSLCDNSSEKIDALAKAPQNDRMALIGAANQDGKLLIKVSPSIFARYKKQLQQENRGIPQSFYITLYGESYDCDTCGDRMVRGALMYDDKIVVCMDEWKKFDRMLGIHTHRAILAVPGVFGIAYDVLPSEENGYGIEITKWKTDPYKGMTFFSGDFCAGPTILDTECLTMALNIKTPKAA